MEQPDHLKAVEKYLDNIVTTLTPQERMFVLHWLAGESKTRAAEVAGYANPDKQGSRLSKRKKIVAAVDEYFRIQEMPKMEVVARLSQQARAEYASYLSVRTNEGGVEELTLNLEKLIADGKGHLIKKISRSRSGDQVIEFYDAHTALVDIGRYHGIFKDNVKIDLDLSGMSDEELNELDNGL